MKRTIPWLLLLAFAVYGCLFLTACPAKMPDVPPETETSAAPDTEPAPCEHTYQTTVTAPTCTTDGTTVYRCTKCGDTYTETEKATGHSFGPWRTVAEPTTSSAGLRRSVCSRCGAEQTETIPQLEGLTPLDPEQYCGYLYLGTLPGASRLEGAYRAIVAAVSRYAPQIDVSAYRLNSDELYTVYMTYVTDYPQHFWVAHQFSYSGDFGTIWPAYLSFEGGIPAARAAFEAAADRLLEGIPLDADEFEKEVFVHDRLVDACSYVADGTEVSHTAFGSLVLGHSVCEGYSKAMQYLMYRCGIQCTTVNGRGSGGNHEWNIVRIGGEYYHLDVTFDDPVGTNYCSYKFFNLTTAQISADHTVLPDMNYMPIPECTATAYYYPTHAGVILEELTAESLAESILEYIDRTGLTDTIILFYLGDITPVADFLKNETWNALRIAKKTDSRLQAVTSLKYIKPENGPQFVLFLKTS